MNNLHATHTMKDLFAALDPTSLINLSQQTSLVSLHQSKQEEEFKENRDRAQDSKAAMVGMNSSTASFHPNHTMKNLFEALDPISFINLSHQNSSISLQSKQQQEFIVPSFALQRGPRYKAYAELRELKLQTKLQPQKQQQQHQQRFPVEVESIRTPLPPIKKNPRPSSIVGRSVPDFSSVLRKENRKPMLEMTPPTSKGRVESKSELRGSKSASGTEKRGGGGGGSMMARKSYANIEELQGLSLGVANAINGEGRRGKNVGGYNRSVLGNRQYGY